MCAWLRVLSQTILAAGALGIGICPIVSDEAQHNLERQPSLPHFPQ